MNVQSDIVPSYGTTFVVPLIQPDDEAIVPSRLNPMLTIDGAPRILATQLASAVPSRVLGRSGLSLAAHHLVIKAAFDMLISGF